MERECVEKVISKDRVLVDYCADAVVLGIVSAGKIKEYLLLCAIFSHVINYGAEDALKSDIWRAVGFLHLWCHNSILQ